MKTFELNNGHSIKVELIEKDSYEVCFYEDERLLSKQLYSKDALEWDFDITL